MGVVAAVIEAVVKGMVMAVVVMLVRVSVCMSSQHVGPTQHLFCRSWSWEPVLTCAGM